MGASRRERDGRRQEERKHRHYNYFFFRIKDNNNSTRSKRFVVRVFVLFLLTRKESEAGP